MADGHPMDVIDRMDICRYIKLLAWKTGQENDIEDGYIDDVL